MAKKESKEKKSEERWQDDAKRVIKATLAVIVSAGSSASKAIVNKDTTLIKASALGDDRSLAQDGSRGPHYLYSVSDAMRLLSGIRSRYLEPVQTSQARAEDKYAALSIQAYASS